MVETTEFRSGRYELHGDIEDASSFEHVSTVQSVDSGWRAAFAHNFDYDVAIVGLGYVGLPTSLAFRASGNRVLGLDLSVDRLRVIKEERADLVDGDRQRLSDALRDPEYEITTDLSQLSRAAAVVVCVPTPVDLYLVPDLQMLRGACANVVDHAVAGQLLMLTSTSYVGSTHDLLTAPLAARGLVAGRDVYIAFSPERINPGDQAYAHEDVARVVGGETPSCCATAVRLVSECTNNVHPVTSVGTAEMTKLVENTFRAVNIALANEFADICTTLGLGVMEVIEAAATKPYGFMAFTPGPGVGGHCIPCDPHYLLWQLRRERLNAPIIEQTMNAIAARPGRVVERARRVLSDRNMSVSGSRILVVGLSYKPDVQDLRESPALEILESLHAAGSTVGYFDPLFEYITAPDGTVMAGEADPVAFEADLVILHTKHSTVDLQWLADAPIVLDTTYRLKDLPNTIQI
ncbi:nucleotide sugar dehydrogenase [Arthrobacter pigmenti]